MLTKENTICCCGPKVCTRVIGWLELLGCSTPALVGSIVLGVNGDKDWNIIGAALAVVGLTFLVNILLIVGNEKDKPGFFLPWLLARCTIVAVCGVGIFAAGLFHWGFPVLFAMLSQMVVSSFLVYAVTRRYNEINDRISRTL